MGDTNIRIIWGILGSIYKFNKYTWISTKLNKYNHNYFWLFFCGAGADGGVMKVAQLFATSAVAL